MSRLVAFILVTTSLLVIAALGWATEPNARADLNTNGILFSETFKD
jgi:hypothetical protein